MAKSEKTGIQFFDKTDKCWYSKEGSDKLALCNSINDIMEGNGELYQFIGKAISVRTFSKDDKEIEKSFFVLFTLADGNYLLLKKSRELR